MADVLPRAVLVFTAWLLSCGLIRKLAPGADLMVFAAVGATWMVGTAAYCAYLRKLRRDIADLGRARGYFFDRSI